MSACEQCGQALDPEKLRKAGAKRRPRFCSRECQYAAFKAAGFYQQVLSRAGNAAQQQYKA